jgi:VanZ family protein
LGVIVWESMRLSGFVTYIWLVKLLTALHIRLSGLQLMQLNHFLRKTGHVSGYGVLCVLAFRAWRRTLSSGAVLAAVFALFTTLATASLDEWHQSFVPGRTGTPVDVAIDMAGAALFLGVALALFRHLGHVQDVPAPS